MRWSLSRLRPLHIALASVAYWIGLTAVKLGAVHPRRQATDPTTPPGGRAR